MSKLNLKDRGRHACCRHQTLCGVARAVYRAHVEPEIVQKWMLGPDGWTMPVCVNEAKPGGKIRYEWTNGKGGSFYLTGEFLELEPYSRIVHVERMHLPDPTPDNHIETRFAADGSGTFMTMRMTLLCAKPHRHARHRYGSRHGSQLCPPEEMIKQGLARTGALTKANEADGPPVPELSADNQWALDVRASTEGRLTSGRRAGKRSATPDHP